MSRSHIDHIVITAPSLEIGAEFVRQTLGVVPQAGGKHPRMGTHNLLLRLGDTQYLEVISTDSDAAPPGRPRWFGLDALRADALPTLAAWVARTDDIQSAVAGCPEALGTIEPMSRGALNWLITIPENGVVPLDGIAPALIQWNTGNHPATSLQDHGLSLARLDIFHPEPERVSRLLKSMDLGGPVRVLRLRDSESPYLTAHIETPQGPRTLSVPGA